MSSQASAGITGQAQRAVNIHPNPFNHPRNNLHNLNNTLGEKQRINRGYDFTEVVAWFAERADRILVLFDAHKLDISDEFKSAIMTLKGHDDKIRCILNKADMVNKQVGFLCFSTVHGLDSLLKFDCFANEEHSRR